MRPNDDFDNEPDWESLTCDERIEWARAKDKREREKRLDRAISWAQINEELEIDRQLDREIVCAPSFWERFGNLLSGLGWKLWGWRLYQARAAARDALRASRKAEMLRERAWRRKK